MKEKKLSGRQRYAKTAEEGYYGYHNVNPKEVRRVADLLFGGKCEGMPDQLEQYVAAVAFGAHSSRASYEENCERAYRAFNSVVKRLRRVRDAFGRTIGKCR